MNPPRHLIEAMLKDGYLGELSSMLCLGAAMAMKRGLPPELTSISDPRTGRPVAPTLEAVLRKVHAAIVMELQNATQDQLDYAIATYTAHLKAAGYSVEAGYEH